MAATNYPNILAGQRITAALLNSMQPQTVIKPSDQSVTSSTTLVNDNDLVAAVVASATYIFACYLDYEGGTQGSSDLKWQWALPSGATLRYQNIGVGTGGGAVTGATCTGATIVAFGTSGAASLVAASMTGTLVMSTSPGFLQFKWAQNTSSGTATIVHAQSSLSLARVS